MEISQTRVGQFNSDGALRGNLGISSYAYCLWDESSDQIYARGARMEDSTNMDVEAYAMLQAVIHCSNTQYSKVIF